MLFRTAKEFNKLLFVLLTLLGLCGCGGFDYKPDFVHEKFNSAEFDHLTILPAADIRKDKSIGVDPDYISGIMKDDFVASLLRERNEGYPIEYADDYGLVEEISTDNIEYPTEQWISKLGSARNRLVLLVVYTDLGVTTGWGKAAIAECQGVMYDKRSNRKVWSHKTIYSFGYNPMISAIGTAVTTNGFPRSAIQLCAWKLSHQIPPLKRS